MSLNQSSANSEKSVRKAAGCLQRGKPEEAVRQKILLYLIEQLHYPRGLILLEVPIGSLIPTKRASKRRIDLVCYKKDREHLRPYLLVECKAERPSGRQVTAAWSQLIGYNSFIQASYLVLAWDKGSICINQAGEITHLPAYATDDKEIKFQNLKIST